MVASENPQIKKILPFSFIDTKSIWDLLLSSGIICTKCGVFMVTAFSHVSAQLYYINVSEQENTKNKRPVFN